MVEEIDDRLQFQQMEGNCEGVVACIFERSQAAEDALRVSQLAFRGDEKNCEEAKKAIGLRQDATSSPRPARPPRIFCRFRTWDLPDARELRFAHEARSCALGCFAVEVQGRCVGEESRTLVMAPPHSDVTAHVADWPMAPDFPYLEVSSHTGAGAAAQAQAMPNLVVQLDKPPAPGHAGQSKRGRHQAEGCRDGRRRNGSSSAEEAASVVLERAIDSVISGPNVGAVAAGRSPRSSSSRTLSSVSSTWAGSPRSSSHSPKRICARCQR